MEISTAMIKKMPFSGIRGCSDVMFSLNGPEMDKPRARKGGAQRPTFPSLHTARPHHVTLHGTFAGSVGSTRATQKPITTKKSPACWWGPPPTLTCRAERTGRECGP